MPSEDLNTGSADLSASSDSPDISAPDNSTGDSPAGDVTPIPHDETPINPVSDVLSAFGAELAGITGEKPVTPGQQPATNGQQPNTPKARSYEGLDPEEIPMFKHMRNEVYAHMYPKYLEYKKQKEAQEQLQAQLKEVQGAQFFEHEGAWTLAPEYRELAQATSQMETEAGFWQSQLENIEAGNQWRPLLRDPQTGRLYPGDPQDPTPQGKAQIMANITKANQYHMHLQNKLQEFEGGFKEKHKGYVSTLQQMRDKVLTKEQQAKIQPHVDKELQRFPTYMRGKPEVQLAASLLVINQGLIAAIRQLKAGVGTQNTQQRTAKIAGPAGGVAVSGGKPGGTVADIQEQFRRAKAGVL
jgi:hypothetical protein